MTAISNPPFFFRYFACVLEQRKRLRDAGRDAMNKKKKSTAVPKSPKLEEKDKEKIAREEADELVKEILHS